MVRHFDAAIVENISAEIQIFSRSRLGNRQLTAGDRPPADTLQADGRAEKNDATAAAAGTAAAAAGTTAATATEGRRIRTNERAGNGRMMKRGRVRDESVDFRRTDGRTDGLSLS